MSDKKEKCDKCNGEGTIPCPACNGSGQFERIDEGFGKETRIVNCSSCRGSGTKTCGRCGGSGQK
jgi:DnaJ-class molecular chaperone